MDQDSRTHFLCCEQPKRWALRFTTYRHVWYIVCVEYTGVGIQAMPGWACYIHTCVSLYIQHSYEIKDLHIIRLAHPVSLPYFCTDREPGQGLHGQDTWRLCRYCCPVRERPEGKHYTPRIFGFSLLLPLPFVICFFSFDLVWLCFLLCSAFMFRWACTHDKQSTCLIRFSPSSRFALSLCVHRMNRFVSLISESNRVGSQGGKGPRCPTDHAHLNTDIHIYMHVYIHTYMHTYIHSIHSMHAYIHTIYNTKWAVDLFKEFVKLGAHSLYVKVKGCAYIGICTYIIYIYTHNIYIYIYTYTYIYIMQYYESFGMLSIQKAIVKEQLAMAYSCLYGRTYAYRIWSPVNTPIYKYVCLSKGSFWSSDPGNGRHSSGAGRIKCPPEDAHCTPTNHPCYTLHGWFVGVQCASSVCIQLILLVARM